MKDADHSTTETLLEGDLKPIEDEEKKQQRKKSITAILFALLASCSFSMMAIFVKLAGSSLPSFHIGFARSLVQWIIVLVVLMVKRINPFGTRKTFLPLLGRGICGFIAMSCYYYGLTHSALGEAVVITFTSPVSTAILARIILKEKWALIDAISTLISLAGVVCIAKPPFIFGSPDDIAVRAVPEGFQKVVTVAILLCGAVMSSFSTVLTRSLGEAVSSFVVVNYFALCTMLGSLALLFAFEPLTIPSGKDWIFLSLVGVAAFIGQSSWNRALQLETAAKITAVSYIQIVFAFLADMFLFLTLPSLWSLVGMFLISCCCGLSILKSWKGDQVLWIFVRPFQRCCGKSGFAALPTNEAFELNENEEDTRIELEEIHHLDDEGVKRLEKMELVADATHKSEKKEEGNNEIVL